MNMSSCLTGWCFNGLTVMDDDEGDGSGDGGTGVSGDGGADDSMDERLFC